MPSLPTAGTKPWDALLNAWLLVGHDVNGNNLVGAADPTKVDKDSIVVAATRIVASKLLAGDAQPAFQLLGNGTHQWGPGGATALDTTLYRNSAGVLMTGGTFYTAGEVGIYNTTAEANPQLYFQRNYAGAGQPGIRFGPGGATALDTAIYRAAANSLYSPGNLSLGGVGYAGAFVANAGGANQVRVSYGGAFLEFGSAADTNLYRSAAATLRTDGALLATGFLAAMGAVSDTQAQVMFHPNYAGAGQPGVRWGPGGGTVLDCDLYRSGPGALVTGSALTVGGNLSTNLSLQSNQNAAAASAFYAQQLSSTGYVVAAKQATDTTGWRLLIGADGRLMWGPGGSAAIDTQLYRGSVGNIATDTAFTANAGSVPNQIQIWTDGRIYFGSAGDTNLYRAAASQLKTDSFFLSAGDLYARAGGATQAGVGAVGPSGASGITFNNADTNLYRSAAGQLKTDGTLQAGILITRTATANATLALTDVNGMIEMNLAGANTLTVPPNSSVAFPIGSSVTVAQYGAGQTTITPGAGVTLRGYNANLKLAGQYAVCTLIKRGTDEWWVSGNLVP